MTDHQAWVLDTTLADRRLRADEEVYRVDCADGLASASRRWREAHARYRAAVLDSFWRNVAPIVPGMVVPHAVAECIADEWDMPTRWHP